MQKNLDKKWQGKKVDNTTCMYAIRYSYFFWISVKKEDKWLSVTNNCVWHCTCLQFCFNFAYILKLLLPSSRTYYRFLLKNRKSRVIWRISFLYMFNFIIDGRLCHRISHCFISLWLFVDSAGFQRYWVGHEKNLAIIWLSQTIIDFEQTKSLLWSYIWLFLLIYKGI